MFLTHRPWPPTGTKKAVAGAVGATPTPLSVQGGPGGGTHTLPPLTHFISLVHVGTLAQQQLHAGRMALESRSKQGCPASLHTHTLPGHAWAAAGRMVEGGQDANPKGCSKNENMGVGEGFTLNMCR